uniref:Gamma carbonic anhydrase n=1 Tax=Tetraselmis sp. GSL018 TaxID=582737 RepID=A0A061S1S6_9CHLO|mmetsp:Transcript_21724/g.51923  ORF Transcript_21724/g.51923 Transcript_21724/m.51923 type:complete len:240 (-) Transcript_21724:175-894(-)
MLRHASRSFGRLLSQTPRSFYLSVPAATGCFHSSAQALTPLHVEEETYCRQRKMLVLEDKYPTAAPDSWVAANAVVVGDVDLQDGVSVWYGSVIRGDLASVTIGPFANIGERTSVTTASASPAGGTGDAKIGAYVSIGAGCSLRSCHIGSETVVEDKCVIMEGAKVGSHCILGAGSVVPPGRTIPDFQMWSGNPARFVREVSKDEVEAIVTRSESKQHLAGEHSFEWLPVGNVYLDKGK